MITKELLENSTNIFIVNNITRLEILTTPFKTQLRGGGVVGRYTPLAVSTKYSTYSKCSGQFLCDLFSLGVLGVVEA